MAQVDGYNNFSPEIVVPPNPAENEGAWTSIALPPQVPVDMEITDAGDIKGFESLCFVFTVASAATAASIWTMSLEEADLAAGPWTLAANGVVNQALVKVIADPFTTASTLVFDDTSVAGAYKLAYVGRKQFVRLLVTPSGAAGSLSFSCVADKGAPRIAPVFMLQDV